MSNDDVQEEASDRSKDPQLPETVKQDTTASHLLSRCHVLLDELDKFKAHLLKEKDYKTKTIDLGNFKHAVLSEQKALQKACQRNPETVIKASNLPFSEAVWKTMKSSIGVTALEKRFNTDRTNSRQACNIIVNIVAQGGLEWVKVSTINERRLLFDMAKAGWLEESSSDEDADSVTESFVHDSKPEGLMKHVQSYLEASRSVRVRYRHPRVRVVLPNLSRRSNQKEIRGFILQLEALGIKVQTSEDIQEVPKLESVYAQLIHDPLLALSSVINIDCTILLAFVSDLSHERVETEDWHHPAVVRQIEVERQKQLLPNILWPACGSRRMVCTKMAATRMHEIIDTIGTQTERQRAKVLLDDGDALDLDFRHKTFQELSSYNVPLLWNLPIEVVEADLVINRERLPSISSDVAKNLSSLNESVFFYGWANGFTTISSNREVANKIIASVEDNRRNEDEIGPDIWVCQTSRSLVGKEKGRR